LETGQINTKWENPYPPVHSIDEFIAKYSLKIFDNQQIRRDQSLLIRVTQVFLAKKTVAALKQRPF
jgi:hypothetical protein